VRFRRAGTGFTIHHGRKYQHKTGGGVFNEITNFLDEHPTETVLVSYQEEHDPMPGSSSFQTILNSYLRRYRRWIYGKNQGEDATVIPRLQDVRGKMVFIDNKCNGNFGIPCHRHKLSKEDNWNNPTWVDKTRGVKRHLEAARRSSGSKLFLTYCSYSALKNFPPIANKHNARGLKNCAAVGAGMPSCTSVHPGMTNFIAFELMDKPKASYGVVIMDYPTMGAIGATMQHNPGIAKACAILENSDRDQADYVFDEEQKSLGGDWWNDKIEYAVLPKACYLKVWQDYRYSGNMVRLHRPGSTHSSRDNAYEISRRGGYVNSWTGYISSYKCFC